MCECCEKLLIATKSNGEPLKVPKEKQCKKRNIMIVSRAERSEKVAVREGLFSGIGSVHSFRCE